MNIAVAIKVVPDDQDIQVNADRSLNYANAKPVVSTYDLNAIEAAAKVAGDTGAKLYAISAGNESAVESKTAKNILARGVDEYVAGIDAGFEGLDAHPTGKVLAALVGKLDGCDMVICGDGSADIYAQQTDVQLACALGWPIVTAVTSISVAGDSATVVRTLENERETVEVKLPAVISVSPDIAMPRVCGMKDILSAGKKPITKYSAADLGTNAEASIEVVSTLAPEPTPRKKEILDGSDEANIDAFVAAIKEAIRQEVCVDDIRNSRNRKWRT